MDSDNKLICLTNMSRLDHIIYLTNSFISDRIKITNIVRQNRSLTQLTLTCLKD